MSLISCNDFELEFLKLYDIEPTEDGFIDSNTGDIISFSEKNEQINSVKEKRKYIYKSKNGLVIEFTRTHEPRKKTLVKVDIIKNGYHHWAEENRDIDVPIITRREIGVDSVVTEIPGVKCSKYISKESSSISVNYIRYSDYISYTFISHSKDYISARDYYNIVASLSALYTNATHVQSDRPKEIDNIETYDEQIELSMENYIKVLTKTINNIFKDEPEMREFYIKGIPYLCKGLESTMIMPFRYREYFNRRMEKRKKRIEQGYTGEEKTAKLKELAEMVRYLDEFYPNLEINTKDANKLEL